jgi:uncharacterized protein YbaR (Trm112 family)
MAMHRLSEFCLCPKCRALLEQSDDMLRCVGCKTPYAIEAGIPILLPRYDTAQQAKYYDCYQDIARDDLSRPLESNRAARHDALKRFIGDVRDKKVLDIGASNALYLKNLDAGFKVALDIARPYLTSISEADGVMRVCGDAEYLPVNPGFFDVIVISDILEHLLHPERLVERLQAACRKGTRVIVHIPWEENLEPYRDMNYEFAHIRSFNAYKFSALWRNFYIKRSRATYPRLDEPIMFRLEKRLPQVLYNALVHIYFETDLWKREQTWRERWLRELPRRERVLLLLYKPTYRIFELRIIKRSVWSYALWKAGVSVGLCHSTPARET